MWKQPSNIPHADWVLLTRAWDARKDAIYARFKQHTDKVPPEEIDGVMAKLLRAYYIVETHAQKGADWEKQLKDEYDKAVLVERQISQWLERAPELRTKTIMRFANDEAEKEVRLADKCMGGIVRAFIDITREVCTERFGQPFEDKSQALRNGIIELSGLAEVINGYSEQRDAYETAKKKDPNAPPPRIYRQ